MMNKSWIRVNETLGQNDDNPNETSQNNAILMRYLETTQNKKILGYNNDIVSP